MGLIFQVKLMFVEFGFIVSQADTSMFIQDIDVNYLIVLVYVNDIIIITDGNTFNIQQVIT